MTAPPTSRSSEGVYVRDRIHRHVASAIARQTGRGWRLDKANRSAQIDAAVALAMACERTQQRVEPARLVGWV